MKILWVEDFGEVKEIDKLVAQLFKELIGETALDNYWDNDVIDLKSQPQALLEFCQRYSPHHEVLLCRHYFDYADLVKKPCAPLQDFEIILIDINLSAGVPDQQTPYGNKHEEAGFWIYNELIRQGFPAENICFITGERKSSLVPFEERCEQIFMPKPLSFEKTDSEYKALRKWLDGKKSNPFLTLRRGIIEGCQYISQLIANHPEFIQFGEFIKTDNGSPVREVMVKDMQEYLESLQNFLPLRQPPDNRQRLYKLFLRTLAHEWEDAAHPDNLPRCDKGDKDCRQVRNVKYTFGWIMKNARNWATHTTQLDNLSAPEVAFLFMVAMRALFKLSERPERYEMLLLELFEKTDPGAMQDIIGTASMNTKLPLSRTYLAVKNQIFQSHTADALDFHWLLKNLGKNQVEFDYVTGLFQMFWHGLSPVRLYERGTSIDQNKNVVFKYSFWLNDYGQAKNGFLFELARSIYQRSFR